MAIYDTEADAKHARQTALDKQLGLFCPIIMSQCRWDCICFNEGSAPKSKPVIDKTVKWFVDLPGCGHVLISGYLTVEM